MEILTKAGSMKCGHEGRVPTRAYQSFVCIEGAPILVEGDPEGVPIAACPIAPAPGIKPCTLTREVKRGYSKLVFIEGYAVCRADVLGFTDGMPPLTASYDVFDPGQRFVSELP